MAYSDPITIGAVAYARTASGSGTGEFRNATGDVVVDVRHSYNGKKASRTIGLKRLKYSADPVNTAINRPLTTVTRVTVVTDAGAANADIKTDLVALLTFLTASSGAMVDKLLAGEN